MFSRHWFHSADFVFRIFLSVGPVVYLSPSAAALSVPECVTKDTTASKSSFDCGYF